MTESADASGIRDIHFSNNIVFGSLNVSLSPTREAISPCLQFAEVSTILDDGEPNLMKALGWKYGLTARLHGRQAELEAVLGWAEGGGNSVSVRLISGPGGAGKTRLAAEAAQWLRERGWSAGFLPRDAPHGQIIDASGRAGGGLLLVIDYPEERSALIEKLFEHIADLVHAPIPIRFLLLSRRSFDDWRRLADLLGGRFGRQELAATGPLDLEEALAVLRDAAESFAGLTELAVPPLSGAGPWLARTPAHRLPLIAMTAGIHAALTQSGDFALGAPELMREIARRERIRVRRVSLAAGLGEFGLERLLGAAVLNAEGLNVRRIEKLGTFEIAPGVAGQTLLDAVSQTPWWELSPLGGGRLIQLEPDRPAAAFLEAALLTNPQPRLPDWLYAACAGTGRELPKVLSRLSWDLNELSADGRGAAPLEQALLTMIDRAPDRAEDFREIVFGRGTAFSAAFGARVLQYVLPVHKEPEIRAMILSRLADYLSDLGRREEALAVVMEAVELRRGLATAEPDEFTPDLATSLVHLAVSFSDLGRHEDALVASGEGIDLHRRLTSASPQLYAPGLANSLTVYANLLLTLGRSEDAHTAGLEAVEILRGLAAEQPDAFTFDLAGALNNSANALSELGLPQDAVAANEEAVGLYRQLAAARPDAFTEYLAGSLNNLAGRLAAVARHEEAIAAATEAVDLRQRLAVARPEAFRQDLAMSLSNLANLLAESGQRGDALAAVQEAVKIYRELADALPEPFTPDLARAFNGLANRFSEIGQHEDALVTAREAVDIYRRLATSRPEAFLSNLASALSNLADCLSNVSQHEEALTIINEAVKILRGLADARPMAFNRELAMALNNLAGRLFAVGQGEDALAVSLEALELNRSFATAGLEVVAPELASTLNNLAGYLSAVGEHKAALSAACEAVEINRKLAAVRPGAFTYKLAGSLSNLGGFLSKLGRYNEALSAAEEAVELYRRLATDLPEIFTPYLARSLSNLATHLAELAQHQEAHAAAREAVELLSPFFINHPAIYYRWIEIINGVYIKACNSLGEEPSSDLLFPIVEVFVRWKIGLANSPIR